MGIAGYGKTEIKYDMFDMMRSAEEAKRFVKCERIYHRGQELAWDGKATLAMLEEKYGGIHIEDEEKKAALKRVFAIILWGELAAWKISAQLADRLVPLEAKMAATSQAHDEARHFYVMYDYLSKLDYVPERLDPAPQALLDLVLDTDEIAYKILGMQLMIETIALTVFQTVRELDVEPVLTELMRYYERDEARHVGLGMQYLPTLMKKMNRRQVGALITFQARIMMWALWELKVLAPDFEVLGLEPRVVLERGRKKQLYALGEAFEAIGLSLEDSRNVAADGLVAVAEVLFPTEENKHSLRKRLAAAYSAYFGGDDDVDDEDFDVHRRHTIQTARGEIDHGDADETVVPSAAE